MVLVSTKDKRKIYEYLLQEGVFCCYKDKTSENEILGVSNYHCFVVLRSLRSRKFVTEIFNWQWHYYFLTPEGVKFLRTYFGFPDTVVPNTQKLDVKTTEDEPVEEEGEGEKTENTGRGRGRGGRGRGRGRGRD